MKKRKNQAEAKGGSGQTGRSGYAVYGQKFSTSSSGSGQMGTVTLKNSIRGRGPVLFLNVN